jgi:hydrogenase maturation protein HypF
MADNGLADPVIGVAWDGAGHGTDGAIWGGEFLVVDGGRFRRAAHLGYVGMPGGFQAVREPWRMAVAHLRAAGLPVDHPCIADAVGRGSIRAADQMLERAQQSPRTSSIGRLFDAVAVLLGIAARATFEGEAAMRLEALAASSSAEGAYPFDLDCEDGAAVIDAGPLVKAIVLASRRGAPAAEVARRFHNSLAAMIRVVCRDIRQEDGPSAVVLSGGVFTNALLAEQVSAELARDGFRVYRQRKVPPNDGGLCLGQLAVAASASQGSIRS